MFDSSYFLLIVISSAIPIAALLLAVIALVGSRGEPDPTGRRTLATYLGVVCFVTLFIAIAAGFVAVKTLSQLVIDEDDRAQTEDDFFAPPTDFDDTEPLTEVAAEDANDRVIDDTVKALLIALPAGLIFFLHTRRRKRLVADPAFPNSPADRVDHAYLFAVAFLAAVVFVFAAGTAAYAAFRIIAPDVTDSLNAIERREGAASLVSAGLLALATGVLFRHYWRAADPPAPTPIAAEEVP